jgi:ketosteroid isomerase-like protein
MRTRRTVRVVPGPALDLLRQFGDVEADQRYTRLIDLFADEAIYHDPLFGPQVGREAILGFMTHMEKVVPGSGVRFDSWTTEADTNCGWANWVMVASAPSGEEVPVAGQSLYRLRNGKVTFVADHLDCRAYSQLGGPDGKEPDHAGAIGLSARPDNPRGSGHDLITRLWTTQNTGSYADIASLFADDGVFTDVLHGEFRGRDAIRRHLERMESAMPDTGVTFEVVDIAADDTVGWSQWNCRFRREGRPDVLVPGWTLHTFRDGEITLDADYFDTNVARTVG